MWQHNIWCVCVRSVWRGRTDAHTSAASSQRNDAPADLNVLVRFAERRNLVSPLVRRNQTQSTD